MTKYCDLCECAMPFSHDHTVQRRMDPHEHPFGKARGWYQPNKKKRLSPGWSSLPLAEIEKLLEKEEE